LRAVLDTNVVLSALLFRRGRVGWLREASRRAAVVPVVSAETVRELVRALGYPKFALSEADQAELLGDFLPYAEVRSGPVPSVSEPRCRDPRDQPFLDLAVAARVDALVTGDNDLVSLAGHSPVAILRAAELQQSLSSGSP
jgi:putative PIN family toxin of toxin-antitoxin system